MLVNCEQCGKECSRKPTQVAKYKQHFCSPDCHYAWVRAQRYHLTCRECGKIQEYPRHLFRGAKRQGWFKGVTIDEATGRGEYLCLSCGAAERGYKQAKRGLRKLSQRGGRRQVLAGRAAGARLARQNPSPKFLMSPEGRWKTALAHITLRPAGQFYLCRLCGYLGYTQKRRDTSEAHGACLDAHLASRGKGRRNSANAWPSRPRGRQLSTDELAVSFTLAVAHLLRGAAIGESREEHGAGLAAWFGLENRAVRRRIEGLLEAFPPDDRSPKRLAAWGRALRWAKSYQGLADWANRERWSWTKVRRRLSGPERTF